LRTSSEAFKFPTQLSLAIHSTNRFVSFEWCWVHDYD
jgi:hypothetical protein